MSGLVKRLRDLERQAMASASTNTGLIREAADAIEELTMACETFCNLCTAPHWHSGRKVAINARAKMLVAKYGVTADRSV